MMDNEKALVWLCACTDTEYRERAQLLKAAGSPVALFEDWENFSAELIKCGKNGLYKKGRSQREEEIQEFLSRAEKKNRFAVTLFSEDYPESLRNISLPPFVLFGEGNRALLKKRKFCIVGSRIIPPWAEKAGVRFAEELSRYFAIVTGLAEGGDCAAISGALASGNLISVLPTGLDLCYPASHASIQEKVKRGGLVLSEYRDGESAKKYSFYARNRILAGLSEGVLVLSAAKRSGTLITADEALENGRDVFALPHNVGAAQGEGCNELLKKGASVATEPEDILFAYGIESRKKETVSLPPEEEKLLTVLRELGEAHISQLAEKAGMQIYEAAAVLSALEMKNLAVKAGGNRYGAIE